MDQVVERIEAWEAAGLIDPATAARLRLAEAERSAQPAMSVESEETSSGAGEVSLRAPADVSRADRRSGRVDRRAIRLQP